MKTEQSQVSFQIYHTKNLKYEFDVCLQQSKSGRVVDGDRENPKNRVGRGDQGGHRDGRGDRLAHREGSGDRVDHKVGRGDQDGS